MIKTTLDIEGMMCRMCEAHICDVIRRTVPAAKKVKASKAKGEATFMTEDTIDGERLKKAIDETGYTCLSLSSEKCEKKGIFGKRGNKQ